MKVELDRGGFVQIRGDLALIPLPELLEMDSGDHGGRIAEFPHGGRRGWWNWNEEQSVSHWDLEKVDNLADSLLTDGWVGPPVCVFDNTLWNGHHRTIAAWMIGMTAVPWSEKDLQYSWESDSRTV